MSDLDPIPCDLKSGDEIFRSDQGPAAALRLLDYWRWAESCLMDNTTRGLLAEFLVAAAIGQHREPRTEWLPYDLIQNPESRLRSKVPPTFSLGSRPPQVRFSSGSHRGKTCGTLKAFPLALGEGLRILCLGGC